MGIFTRKKKTAEPVSQFRMLNGIQLPLVPFGDNITKSDVVMICIDRVASQCAKLKGRYIKKDEQGIQTEKNGELAFILKYKSNPLMTPYQFIYKTVALLLLNDNAFIYPIYDSNSMKLTGTYPLNPILVEPLEDTSHSYYLKFYFEDGSNYTLPYENVIHLKRFYGKNDIFGGANSNGDHDAILKTIKTNDALLQGVESAVFSSFQIKGLIEINGMLKEADKQKQVD